MRDVLMSCFSVLKEVISTIDLPCVIACGVVVAALAFIISLSNSKNI